MVVQQDILKTIPYFGGLSSEDLEYIRRFVVEREAERGKILVMEGDSSSSLFFLISGAVKTFKTSADGKEQILTIVRPGESFNGESVFGDGINLYSVQTMGPIVYYEITKSNIEIIIRRYPKIASNVIQILAGQIRCLIVLVEDLSFKNVTGRVAKILLNSARDAIDVRRRFTQQEMAAIAGTSREVVGRSLKSLEEMGVIKFDLHKLIIKDIKGLERVAVGTG